MNEKKLNLIFNEVLRPFSLEKTFEDLQENPWTAVIDEVTTKQGDKLFGIMSHHFDKISK